MEVHGSENRSEIVVVVDWPVVRHRVGKEVAHFLNEFRVVRRAH